MWCMRDSNAKVISSNRGALFSVNSSRDSCIDTSNLYYSFPFNRCIFVRLNFVNQRMQFDHRMMYINKHKVFPLRIDEQRLLLHPLKYCTNNFCKTLTINFCKKFWIEISINCSSHSAVKYFQKNKFTEKFHTFRVNNSDIQERQQETFLLAPT